jgi:hypothetical protein
MLFTGCARTVLRVESDPRHISFRNTFKVARTGVPSTLALLVALVGANDVNNAPAAHDLAVFADLLD